MRVMGAVFLAFLIGCGQPVGPAQPIALSEKPAFPESGDDIAILAAVSEHVLTEREFVWRKAQFGITSQVLVDSNSARISGFLSAHQIRSEFRSEPKMAFPDLLFASLLERNQESRRWEEFVPPDSRILMVNLAEFETRENRNSNFSNRSRLEDRFPRMAVWIQAWRPGYSDNGQQAVLRFHIGPSPHASIGTYILEKVSGHWYVRTWKFSYFA